MDLDGRQAIVVPIVDGPRAAFVEWVGIEGKFRGRRVAFTDNKDVIGMRVTISHWVSQMLLGIGFD